jgi:predicted phage tail protein
MGKTVESFRIALKGEIGRRNGRKSYPRVKTANLACALRKSDREAFDEFMDIFSWIKKKIIRNGR